MTSPSLSCPSCNFELPTEADFCMKCGTQTSANQKNAPADPLRDTLVTALGSQYEVMRLLGRGGMGAVYLAREKALDRLVAVKVLPPEASDDESRERFVREARTAAKLTHPNIVPLYTFGDSGGTTYFVMGFVQGESLADRIARDGKMTEKEARRVLADVADALNYAHTQQVVHRDIKPDNILIDDATGKPMLTDFGIAKAQTGGTTLTAIGSIVGTPHYMSPEQASGDRDLDGRSDIYSLGVVAFRMLSGKLPFDGLNLQDIIVQHVTKDAPNLKDVAGETSEKVARAVGRCLAKAPEDRWSDAAEFRSAIREEGLTDTNLPLALRVTEGMVPKGLLLITCAMLAAPVLYLQESTFFPSTLGVTVGMLLGGVLGWVRMLRTGKKKGFSIAELKTLALKPPRWWPFGWPRRWRRPEDVWSRLDTDIKKMRNLFGWSGMAFTSGFYLMILTMSFENPPFYLAPTFASLAALLGGGGFVALAVKANLWARKHGVEPSVLSKAIQTPTSRLELWRSPELTRLLTGKPPQEIAPSFGDPQTPRAYLDAIRLANDEVRGADRALIAEALSAARQLVSSIEKAEKEIKRTSHDVNEGEVLKLEARLQSLGENTNAKDDYDVEMEQLLQSQLLLHRRIAERQTAARDRHDRMNELLKLLWLQVSDLQAQASRESHDSSEITGKIRAICGDIELHVEATEETVRALSPE